MNLLASETVSINNLLSIIAIGKDEKDMNKIREIARNADEDGMGYIDQEEFSQFVRDLITYRQDLIVKSSLLVKKLLSLKWGEEKEERIKEYFKQLCLLNIVISRNTIETQDMVKIITADKQLAKRYDI